MTTTSGYSLGERLDMTSRVVISDAVRRGASGFRKSVTVVSLRREVASRDPLSARAFLEASQHFAALSHESLLPVEDVGVGLDDCPFAVTPRLRGRVLAQLFVLRPPRPQPLAPRVALRVVARIAGAAHAVSSRLDAPLGGLTADAVWVGEGGRVFLLPSAYRRPDRAVGAERPDVQALGLLLWDLLVFGRTADARFDATRAQALPFDRAIVQVVMRALASSPAERFLDASALGGALSLLAEAQPGAVRSALSVMPSPVRSVFAPAFVHAIPAEEPATIRLPAAKIATGARLSRVSGGAEHQLTLAAPARRWVIGRSGAVDLVLSDPEVSRRHFEVVLAPSGGYLVRDLGSKNGLFVNGVAAFERLLSSGDEVRAGDTVLRFDA